MFRKCCFGGHLGRGASPGGRGLTDAALRSGGGVRGCPGFDPPHTLKDLKPSFVGCLKGPKEIFLHDFSLTQGFDRMLSGLVCQGHGPAEP